MGDYKQRGRRKRTNDGIKEDEWREYFMSLMGGIRRESERGKRKGRKVVREDLKQEVEGKEGGRRR